MQQDSLFSSDSPQQDQAAGPVTCLGKTFASDQARRDYFLAMLAEKLKDPEFRKIEGFPIGSDEDILNLSDPPYYTACPNPWIGDFVAEWEAQKPASDEEYHREPFAADVSEGKNDPIYNAHSYHTKVPHKAIMRYILHYTNPGDIVFDGFCGSGMTGVAAQMCGNRETVTSLGYQVTADGTILKEEVDESGKITWTPFSKLGIRKSVLNDLSPYASFIASRYNDFHKSQYINNSIFSSLLKGADEIGVMYSTRGPDNSENTIIDYIIWSEVFSCPNCQTEYPLFDIAVDKTSYDLIDKFSCPCCSQKISKDEMDRVWVSDVDASSGEVIKSPKTVIVEIVANINGKTTRYKPTNYDQDIIDEIGNKPLVNVTNATFPHGRQTRKVKTGSGITKVHQMFTKRSLHFISKVLNDIKSSDSLTTSRTMLFLFSSILTLISKRERFRNGTGKGAQSGTLYVPSLQVEKNPFVVLKRKHKALSQLELYTHKKNAVINVCSNADINHIPNNSLDYIFMDPPFGESLQYGELNFFHESWFNVWSALEQDCVMNYVHKKDLHFYQVLMRNSFSVAYKKLKPGRWLTVEFSNTQANVWNSIQQSLQDAGFIVANVSALDKKQRSFNSVVTTTSVKQDLVISAYKPNEGFENRFFTEASTEEGVWDFTRTHLKYLPVVKVQEKSLLAIPERDPRIIFDQVVAYYVRKGFHLPIDSKEFQLGLVQRFIERDGMFFLPEQAAEYDKKKISCSEFIQTSLFVKDEASAIDWLRQLLRNKPQTFADINPLYMQQLSGFSKHEVTLDLRELLSQNFLCYDGQDEVPDQIHSYLSSNWKELRNLAKNDPSLIAKAKDRWYVPDPNKAGDLEKLREKSLLKEFEGYKAAKKKLKVFRIEAVRVGFKKLWEQQEFAALIAVAEKLPSNVLEEDPVLLMYFDQAVTLSQVDADDEW
ncbi:DNA methyltransferase [Aeromonas caviae]|uniref:DNA methyltransferase n=1 Tax=Aeromonas caviae TaxID=648 RepID=UPI0030A380F1